MHVLCTPYNQASVYTVMSFKATCVGCHMCRVHVSLAVTCHLHSRQKDWDLLRAIAVTWGWNGYRSKSQCRKLTLEKKTLPLLLLGLKPMTFQSPVWHSTTDLFLSAALLYCVDWWNAQWSQFDSSIQVNIIWQQLISLVTNALSLRRLHQGHCFYIITTMQPEPELEEKPLHGGMLWMQKF